MSTQDRLRAERTAGLVRAFAASLAKITTHDADVARDAHLDLANTMLDAASDFEAATDGIPHDEGYGYDPSAVDDEDRRAYRRAAL